MKRRYLRIEENFGRYYFRELTLGQKELKFEDMTCDWNLDNDVYTMNVCLFEGNYGTDYYSKEDFNNNFVELKNLEEDKMFLDTRNYRVYDKILKVNHRNKKLVYFENINDEILLTKEEFETYMKEIKIIE